MRIATSSLAAAVCLLAIAGPASAQTAGGANSRYVESHPILPVSDTCIQTITGMTGKSSRVLVITTTLHDNDAGCSTSNVYLHPVVNGIEVSPSGYASFKTNSSTICFDNRTAQWWLDIDAHGLVGVPLTICLEGSAFPSQAFQVITSAIQEAK